MSRSLVSRRMFGPAAYAIGLAAVAATLWAGQALADAPDPVVSQTHLVGQPVHNPDGSITVTIAGGWQWTTHHSDCSTDRAGVGYAIAWNGFKSIANPYPSSANSSREGKTMAPQEETALTAPILAKYEEEGSAYYSTARLWDDGIIEPAETRTVLALSLSAVLNAPVRGMRPGVFRM